MHKNSMNKVILIGNIGDLPEKRVTQSGTSVVNLSIATTESQKRGDGYEDVTEWHKVVLFGGQADFVSNYAQKGRKVYVDGRLKTRKWTDKQNVVHYTTEVHGDTIMFLDGQRSSDSAEQPASKQSAPAQTSAAKQAAPQIPDTDEDDLPF